MGRKDYIELDKGNNIVDNSNEKIDCINNQDDDIENVVLHEIVTTQASKQCQDYLIAQYRYQKVIFFCGVGDFERVSELFASDDYQACVIGIAQYDDKCVDDMVGQLREDIRIIVSVGDEKLANIVKLITNRSGIDYILYIERLCPVATILPYALDYKRLPSSMVVSPPVLTVIETEQIVYTPRDNIASTCMNLLAKLGYFTDYVLNFVVYKTDYNSLAMERFGRLYSELYQLLDKIILLDGQAIIRLQDIIVALAGVLVEIDYDYNMDKEALFASLYHIFADEPMDRVLLEGIGSRIFAKLYHRFTTMPVIGSTYIDIEKRVRLFDKYFRQEHIEYNFLTIPMLEQTSFILRKNHVDLLSKINIMQSLSNKLLAKCIRIFSDSGYLLSLSLQSDAITKASFFTPELLVGNGYLRIIRDFGVMDYEID